MCVVFSVRLCANKKYRSLTENGVVKPCYYYVCDGCCHNEKNLKCEIETTMRRWTALCTHTSQ